MSSLRWTRLLLLVMATPVAAWAGFDEALKAIQAKDFALAQSEARASADGGDPRGNFLLGVMLQSGLGVSADPVQAVAQFEKAAQGGVAGAYSRLAQAYARGAGVARDGDKAIAYARKSAQIGEPEGTFFLSVILTNEYLSYLDANGKPDNAKYAQLAKRPLSERAVDTEARDALYYAAGKGLPQAMNMLALTFGASIGDGNRKRLQVLTEKLAGNAPPAVQNFGRIARYMDSLGESYASPQLFADAQAAQMFAAMVQTCGLQKANEGNDKPAPPKLLSTRITKPVTDAVYLPSRIAGYEKAYLVSGQWEEGWTYSGCDRTATVTVGFVADGFGGARFISQQLGRDIPGVTPGGRKTDP